MISAILKNKIKRIRLLIMDVDGVLTDGKIVLDHQGRELKFFDVQDGSAIVNFHRAGYKTAIISAKSAAAVKARAKDLGIDKIYQNAYPKRLAYRRLLQSLRLKDHEVCYIGDDLADLGVLKRVGFAVGVPNAIPEVKAVVHHVTRKRGGHGAVREVIELILKTQGKWTKIVETYSL